MNLTDREIEISTDLLKLGKAILDEDGASDTNLFISRMLAVIPMMAADKKLREGFEAHVKVYVDHVLVNEMRENPDDIKNLIKLLKKR